MLTLVMCWYANAGIEVNVQNEVYNCSQMLPYNINLEDRKNPTKFPPRFSGMTAFINSLCNAKFTF